MALGGDLIKKNPDSSVASPPFSEVTAEEKQFLYKSIKPRRSRRTIDSRFTLLIFVTVVLGLLAAVFAIRLFPM